MNLVTAVSPKMGELVSLDATWDQLASGCTFTEGPLWIAAENALYFSDMPADTRRKWTRAGGVEVVASPSNKVNGTTLCMNGNQLLCEHVTSSVAVLRDGVREVVVSHYGDKELNSPNDIVVTSDGAIWFTDPPYGRWPGFGEEREQELDFCGVYRFTKTDGLQLATDSFNKPNGLCFSPDEKTLWINDSEDLNIRRFDVAADGSLAGGEVIYQWSGEPVYSDGVPDGLKLDEAGNLWCTGPGGVWVITPEGEHLGTINSQEVVGNLCWGDDWHTLFLCTSTTVHALKTTVAGHRSAAFR
ncbi:MAG: SMP-30/gluconolactonase/LRE family protein [Thermoleophilia bacterium]|nr:SMP-30/gluconolactonase/LRE family protein [Thermoleophilia bacterium]